MGGLPSIVLQSLHKCNKITCIYWCFTPLCLCRHLEIPSATMTSGDYSAQINFTFRGLHLSVRTHVCGSRHPTADLRQRIFPSFSFMFGCLHVSDSDLRRPMCDSDFFDLGPKKSDGK